MKFCALILSVTFALVVSGCTEKSSPLGDADTRGALVVLESGVVTRHSNTKIGSKTAAAFDRFTQDAQSYGAMYVRPDGNGWYFSTGDFTLEDAKLVASVGCKAVTSTDCRLYATLSPATPAGPDAAPEHTRDGFLNAKQNNGAGRVFGVATSAAGGYGWSWNTSSPGEAFLVATEACKNSVKNTKSNTEPHIREAFEAEGLYECRPFATYR